MMKTKTPLTLLTILGLAAILMMPSGITYGDDDDINRINGNSNDNEIVGTPLPDLILGRDGNDEIDGDGGKDDLRGGSGEDTIRGGDGNDVISGQGDDDYLVGDDGDDDIRGNAGNDEIFGGAGHDSLLHGQTGDDEVSGGSGNDAIKGGSGNDVLLGNSGDDSMHGGSGNDLLNGGPGDDDLFSGKGYDILKGDIGNDNLVGHSKAKITTFDGGEKDDDFDGKFNEDPVDGIDNDGDGKIDEDPDDPADQDTCWWDGGPANGGNDILVKDNFGNNTCETVFLLSDTNNRPPKWNVDPSPPATFDLFSIEIFISAQGGDDDDELIYTAQVTDSGTNAVQNAKVSMDFTVNGVFFESADDDDNETGTYGTVVFEVDDDAPNGNWNVDNVSVSHSNPLLEWDGIAPVVPDFPFP